MKKLDLFFSINKDSEDQKVNDNPLQIEKQIHFKSHFQINQERAI